MAKKCRWLSSSNFHMVLKQDWSFELELLHQRLGEDQSYVIGSAPELATRILDVVRGWSGTSCHSMWLVHRSFSSPPDAIVDFPISHRIHLEAGSLRLHHNQIRVWFELMNSFGASVSDRLRTTTPVVKDAMYALM